MPDATSIRFSRECLTAALSAYLLYAAIFLWVQAFTSIRVGLLRVLEQSSDNWHSIIRCSHFEELVVLHVGISKHVIRERDGHDVCVLDLCVVRIV